MISSKTIGKVVTLSDARAVWPKIFDLSEIQEGGCPEFWKSRGADPVSVLECCGGSSDWSAFWEVACPAGCLMYQSHGAWLDEQDELLTTEGEVADTDSTILDSGEAAAEVLRALVEGRLESEDPAIAKQTRRGIILYWPFVRSE